MDAKRIKTYVRSFVYGISGLIVTVIVIRIFFRAIGANSDAAFVEFWYNFSDIFVSGFRGSYANIASGALVVEVFSLLAVVFYLAVAFLFYICLSAIFEKNQVKVLKNIIDALFKVVEFFLFARFLLKVTGALTLSPFVRFMYDISSIVYEPFAGILPSVHIPAYNINFETSTLIAIVIIVAFDFITEGIIDSIVRNSQVNKARNPKSEIRNEGTTIVDRRTINIINPTPAQVRSLPKRNH